jgi:hypothetical protein
MKQFLFLYPLQDIMDFEVKNNSSQEKECPKVFREKYKKALNKCIDLRYRRNGFGINYAIFDDCVVSDLIEMQKDDRVIHVGMNLKVHRTIQSNGEYPYPNPDYILNQLQNPESLRVTDFHLWDCVQRVAKRGYERGLNVLVDEDLTELFSKIFMKPEFRIKKFPGYYPKNLPKRLLPMLMESRRDKPWMLQEY